jgi:hypothetical protein
MNEIVLTPDEIDTHISKLTNGGGAKSLTGANLCTVYKVVRPILILIKTFLIIKPDWQKIIQLLIDELDKACPQK